MSEPNGAQGEPTEQAGESQHDEPAEQDPVEYWKQRSRQHEDRAKQLRKQLREAEPKAAELDERKAAEQTEVDKLTTAKADADTRAQSAETELMKLRAAVKAGVGPEDVDVFASRLRGETAEELEADAAELKRLFAGSEQPEPTPERKPDFSQGTNGNGAISPAQEFANFMHNKMG